VSHPKGLLIHTELAHQFGLAAFQAALHRPLHDAVDLVPTELPQPGHGFLTCRLEPAKSPVRHAVNRLDGSAHDSLTIFTPRSWHSLRGRFRMQRSSGTDTCPDAAIGDPVHGRTACKPRRIRGTATPASLGAAGERRFHPLPALTPLSPRTKGLRFRECVDRVRDPVSRHCRMPPAGVTAGRRRSFRVGSSLPSYLLL
jgi:hypothetical protein